MPRDGVASLTTDAAGVVAACIQFGMWEPRRDKTTLTLNGFRDLILTRLLEAITAILNGAEAYGRTLLELNMGRVQDVIDLDDEGGPKSVPANLPTGGEITLPLDPEKQELEAIADQWRSDVGRAAGYLTLRP